MNEALLSELRRITAEERAILNGEGAVEKTLYTEDERFVVDSGKMLDKGRLLTVRPNTRFVHFPRHGHGYIEVMYVCEGSCTHIMDGKERVVLERGDLLFLGANTRHELLPSGEGDIAVNFIILPEFFDRPVFMMEEENVLRDFLLAAIAGEGNPGEYLRVRTAGHLPAENLIESMIWSIIHRRSDTATLLQSTMGLLLLHLSELTEGILRGGRHRDEKKTVLSVLKYIDTRYKDGSLAEAAHLVGQPAYTVSRLLSRHAGGNFKELLQRRKMQQAAFLLSNTTLPIERIREAIGYNNSSYFYRTFKQMYECSPHVYREGQAQK